MPTKEKRAGREDALMNLERIRLTALRALGSIDFGPEKLVLKGGNALSLLHNLGGRSSLDLDFSLQGDFEDLEVAKVLVFAALRGAFAAEELLLFDEDMSRRPRSERQGMPEWWGGYEIRFKLCPGELAALNLDVRRRTATVIGPAQERIFTVQVSRYEFLGTPTSYRVDGVSVAAYSPAMIAAEKLRAICQQMPSYELTRHRRARARDFYDIHAICTSSNVELSLPENQGLIRSSFKAKAVPLHLLQEVAETREFHRADWAAVEASVAGPLDDFDFYFDFVLQVISQLETLRDE